MSTQVVNEHGASLRVYGDELPNVGIEIQRRNGARVDAPFLRAEFLAAVAAECGVIIIDRNDLPEVRPFGQTWYAVDDAQVQDSGGGGEEFRRTARRALAVAEYLDAHPPVDEADVEALTDVIRKHAATNEAYPIAHRDGGAAAARADALARELLREGWKR